MIDRILPHERSLLAVALVAGLLAVVLPRVADGPVVGVIADVGLFVAAATMISLAGAMLIARSRGT